MATFFLSVDFYQHIRIISAYLLKMQITGPRVRSELATLMGGRTWSQNFDIVQCWILICTKAWELRWEILSLAVLSESIAKIIPKMLHFLWHFCFLFQAISWRKKKLKETLGSFYSERKTEKFSNFFPTQQVLTFQCALKEETFLPPKWYFQGCLLVVCYLEIKYNNSLQPILTNV